MIMALWSAPFIVMAIVAFVMGTGVIGDANPAKAFAWFWWSLAFAVAFVMPWGAILARAGRLWRTKAPATGASSQIGGFLSGAASSILSGMQKFVGWVWSLIQRFPLVALTIVLLLGAGWFGYELDREMSIGNLTMFVLLLHGALLVALHAAGLLLGTLRFLERHLVFTGLYLLLWALIFAAVEISSKEYNLGESAVWLVAVAFSIFMVAVAYAIKKAVDRYMPE